MVPDLKAMLAGAFLLLAVMVSGAEEKAAPHPLTNMPKAGKISTGYFFPDFPNKKFPAGDLVKLVLGIHNDASEAYNISAILGSINSVTDFSLYVQNFTNQLYFQELEPGKELTIEYAFQTSSYLPARDFIIALTLFYTLPTGQYLSTTFFNQTIEIVEKKQFIDFDLIFMYLILAGLAAGTGWLFLPYIPTFGYFNKKGPKKTGSGSKGRSTQAPPTSEEKAAEDDEWIKGTPYDAFRRKKSAASFDRGEALQASKKDKSATVLRSPVTRSSTAAGGK